MDVLKSSQTGTCAAREAHQTQTILRKVKS